MNISMTLTSDERTKALAVLRDGIQQMIDECEVDADGALDTPSTSNVDRKASDLLDEVIGILGLESTYGSRW